MKPILFKGYQAILGAPKNWDAIRDGECEGLPIMRVDGHIYSCWKPSFIERVKLMFGMPITMVVANSKSQPPIALEVRKP